LAQAAKAPAINHVPRHRFGDLRISILQHTRQMALHMRAAQHTGIALPARINPNGDALDLASAPVHPIAQDIFGALAHPAPALSLAARDLAHPAFTAPAIGRIPDLPERIINRQDDAFLRDVMRAVVL